MRHDVPGEPAVRGRHRTNLRYGRRSSADADRQDRHADARRILARPAASRRGWTHVDPAVPPQRNAASILSGKLVAPTITRPSSPSAPSMHSSSAFTTLRETPPGHPRHGARRETEWPAHGSSPPRRPDDAAIGSELSRWARGGRRRLRRHPGHPANDDRHLRDVVGDEIGARNTAAGSLERPYRSHKLRKSSASVS